MSGTPDRLERFLLWRRKLIAEAAGREEPMFMGVPDAWYDPPTWGCENGHVSRYTLRSEEIGGDACLECRSLTYLVPQGTTEEELMAIVGPQERNGHGL